jgi:putative endonuclease
VSRPARATLGELGEELAARYLQQRGYEIVARNARVGRLELDVIARLDALLVFCEVRTRSSRALMEPIESIDRKKRQRIRSAAQRWLAQTCTAAYEIRFDAASIVIDDAGTALTYYEDAF